MRKRNSRCLGIIFLFFIFSLGLVQAQNITLEYNDEVDVNQEFEISLELIDFSEDTYDVKIDIIAESEKIAEIFDPSLNEYRNTWKYINDILEPGNIGKFKMKIIKEYEGEANITIKIRDSSKKKIEVFEGFTISINLEEVIEEEEEENEPDETIEEEEIKENNEVNDGGEVNNKSTNEEIKNLTTEKTENEVIILTPQSIKNPESKEIIFRSKNERTKSYAIYGFAVFLVLIIILLILDKIQKER